VSVVALLYTVLFECGRYCWLGYVWLAAETEILWSRRKWIRCPCCGFLLKVMSKILYDTSPQAFSFRSTHHSKKWRTAFHVQFTFLEKSLLTSAGNLPRFVLCLHCAETTNSASQLRHIFEQSGTIVSKISRPFWAVCRVADRGQRQSFLRYQHIFTAEAGLVRG